jgi:transcription elongation factor Elf1
MKKTCTQCGVEQRVMDYYRTSAGGFMAVCKACHRANVKANREANADYYREFDKARANLPHRVEARSAYQKTPEGLAAGNRAKRRYTERNPVKKRATVAVNNALRDGRLIRQPCETCGERAQAHHDDYSKPLDVRWLCTTHHAEWHRNNTPICPDQSAAA